MEEATGKFGKARAIKWADGRTRQDKGRSSYVYINVTREMGKAKHLCNVNAIAASNLLLASGTGNWTEKLPDRL